MGNSPLKRELKSTRSMALHMDEQLSSMVGKKLTDHKSRNELQNTCKELCQKINSVLNNFIEDTSPQNREVLKTLSAQSSIMIYLLKILMEMETQIVDVEYS